MSTSRPTPTAPQPPAGAPPAPPAPPPAAEERPPSGGASPLARRIGPVIAVVGLLVAVTVLAWVAIAPDNVVGTVAEAGLDVPATAALGLDDDACLTLVEGDGSTRELCTDIDPQVTYPDTQPWWSEDGLVVDTRDGPVVIDPDTGEVVEGDLDEGDGPWREGRFRDEVWVDRDVVRLGSWGDEDGEVVMDVGGPVRSLRDAIISPDGEWVVATSDDDRVLVAATDAPDEVHVWFELDEDRWFDAWGQVRWDD